MLAAVGVACERDEAPPTQLSIFAASSLTEAFGEIASNFERANPTVDVNVTTAGSQVLRLHIEQGATADVFASADEVHITALVEGGAVREPVVFAHNELVVIVPLDNPARIGSFGDLPRAERIVIGTSSVPVGAYTRALLERARGHLGPEFVDAVRARVVSEESNVRLVRAKVELGEADAALVYRTDALASENVRMVELPPDLSQRADYSIGIVARTAHPGPAHLFIAHVRSDEGQRILAGHGFEARP